MIIRPVALGDLDQLEQLAREAGPGMTNFPADRNVLEEKIQLSIDSFAKPLGQAGEEAYLFALEDPSAQRIAGTSGVIASVGLSKPFYTYKVLQLTHTSEELNKYETVRILQMVNEYHGASEIGMLYLTPDYRKNANGRFLSRCRYLFLAEFPERFGTLVMAEMRGVTDEHGRSVFWDSLGRHFFDMEFSKADFLSAQGHYQFIADLMPKFPIYIRLLPKAAQAVIGVPNKATEPALKLLQREGFRFEGCVDVFDAGPTVHCPLEQILSVRESVRARVAGVVDHLDAADSMISTTRLDDFRICRGKLLVDAHGDAYITRAVAELLDIETGALLRFIHL